jgi:hypothetical protein
VYYFSVLVCHYCLPPPTLYFLVSYYFLNSCLWIWYGVWTGCGQHVFETTNWIQYLKPNKECESFFFLFYEVLFFIIFFEELIFFLIYSYVYTLFGSFLPPIPRPLLLLPPLSSLPGTICSALISNFVEERV